MINKGISTIICCYNSGSRIIPTLFHICTQELPVDFCIQLIVVDNVCTDNTIDIVRSKLADFNNSLNIDLLIVKEPIQGLIHARKKGLSCAIYDYIVFCDDDNWLDKYYLAKVFDFFCKNQDVAIVGGVGEAVFDDNTDVPFWFDRFKTSYATGKPADCSNNEMQTVYGASLALQKKLVLDPRFIKSPDYLSGRQGGKLMAGDDTELCLKARLLGYKVGYYDELKFKHYIPVSRLGWDYLKGLQRGFAQSFIAIDLYQKVLNGQRLTVFFWLKQFFYYVGIYLKYWRKQYAVYKNKEGTAEEVNHISWAIIAKTYLRYNFKTYQMYRSILALKYSANHHLL